MPDVPRVSVVIPSGRGPTVAAEAVRWARAASDGVAAEVVVVANGPRWPITVDIPGAVVVRSLGVGPAAARNAGIAAARGELIACMDDDCIPQPGWLAALVAVADAGGPGLGGVGGPVVAYAPRTFLGRLANVARPLDAQLAADAPRRYLVTANALLRRAALDEVGPFDERFLRPGGEDLELSERLLRAGYELGWAPDALMQHQFDVGWRAFVRTHYNYGVGTAYADTINGIRVRRRSYVGRFVWFLWHWDPTKTPVRYGLADRLAALVRLVGQVRYAGRLP